MTKSNVHIIIPTKEKIEILFQCLDSIYVKTKLPNYYVWIADTGTRGDLKERIRVKLDEMNMKYDSKNKNFRKQRKTFNLLEFNYYHFSKINNEVVQYLEKNERIADTDFILFCNNDIKLIDDCISGCVDTYDHLTSNNINVGTLGIRLHFPDNTIQHCGLEIIIKDNHIRISHKNYRYSKGFITDTRESIGVTGAFLFTPYKVFSCCGKFNENYIEGSQDIEFNLECIRKGFKNFIIGQIAAYHYESLTRNENKDKKLNENFDFNTNLFPYIIKNFQKFKHLCTIIE
jgi:O-antigen biosynthesis protein